MNFDYYMSKHYCWLMSFFYRREIQSNVWHTHQNWKMMKHPISSLITTFDNPDCNRLRTLC